VSIVTFFTPFRLFNAITVQVDPIEGKELEKNKLKVRELCEEMVRKGHAPHLQLDKITAAQLAMETLLSLTSKKAGEWFKEELRVLGGLDHIIQTVTVCTAVLTPTPDGISNWEWDKSRLDALKKVDRCLRVLENVRFLDYLLYRTSRVKVVSSPSTTGDIPKRGESELFNGIFQWTSC
jgi:hypothetical protein